MRDVAVQLGAAAGVGVLFTLAALVICACYAVVVVPLLPALGLLQRFCRGTRSTLTSAQRATSMALGELAERVTGRAAVSPALSRDAGAGEQRRARSPLNVVATVVFFSCAVASLLVMVAAGPLVGLGGWSHAHTYLVWVLAFTLLASAAYSYRCAERRFDLARVSTFTAAGALMAFAIQRGADLMVQWVIDQNALLALPGDPVALPPTILLTTRTVVPGLAFILAELALILGALVSDEGLDGLLSVVERVVVALARALMMLISVAWWAICVAVLVLVITVLRVTQAAINLAGYVLRGVLAALELVVEMLSALPRALLHRAMSQLRGTRAADSTPPQARLNGDGSASTSIVLGSAERRDPAVPPSRPAR